MNSSLESSCLFFVSRRGRQFETPSLRVFVHMGRGIFPWFLLIVCQMFFFPRQRWEELICFFLKTVKGQNLRVLKEISKNHGIRLQLATLICIDHIYYFHTLFFEHHDDSSPSVLSVFLDISLSLMSMSLIVSHVWRHFLDLMSSQSRWENKTG